MPTQRKFRTHAEDLRGRPSISDQCRLLIQDPWTTLVLQWNWKASVLSSLSRGSLFFIATAKAGAAAAIGAMCAEFAYRSVTAGFYGAITQHFSNARPRWFAGILVSVGIPLLSHTLEFLIHSARHTPHLKASMGASMAFTIVATLVNFRAMRHGVLTVGQDSGSILRDFILLPRIVAAIFFRSLVPEGTEREQPNLRFQSPNEDGR